MSMKVKYVKIKEGAITPSRGSDMAAGYDLYACLEYPVFLKQELDLISSPDAQVPYCLFREQA